MAERALQKLEDQLNCSICLDIYFDPKQLMCQHVFCRKCLVKLVVRDQQGQLTLTCPVCRHVTPVPANGTAGLQPAFQINNLLEIVEEHKRSRGNAEAVSPAATPGSTGLESKTVYCQEHATKEVELYCETCGEPICVYCVTKGGGHMKHNHEPISEAFEKFKEDVAASLKPMEEQVSVITRALEELKSCSKEIHDKQTAIESQIHDTFRKIHQVLEVRETELIDQLGEITREKLKTLDIQRDQIETTLAQLSSCLHFMQASLESADGPQVLMMKANTQSQIKKLTTTFQPDILEPVCKADMIFLTPTDLSTECQNFGVVSLPDFADASKSYVTLGHQDHIFVDKANKALLHAIDSSEQPCKRELQSLECELLSEPVGVKVNGTVERRGRSEYVLSYMPAVAGRHQLHIRIDRQHIRGSPFTVVAKCPPEKLDGIGNPFMSLQNLRKPWGVAITKRGEIVVTEWEGHWISVISYAGENLHSFGKLGSAEGQLHHPRGVTVDGRGNIVVVDAGNCRVQKFTLEGRFVAALGRNSPQPFEGPRDIVFNATNNKLYVTDKYCVHILNSDLTFSSAFGATGHSMSEFSNAWGITCDSSGKVYVSDGHNNRVQVFTAEGNFLESFRVSEPGIGWPVGIGLDQNGMTYVCDRVNGCISIFACGQLFASFGKFVYVGGLVVHGGVIYVCDINSGCLYMYHTLM